MSLAGHFPWQIKLSNIRQDTENWALRSEMGNFIFKKTSDEFTLVVTCWGPGVSKDI
jgi:hypothetical protein